jgi:hypothetical protein
MCDGHRFLPSTHHVFARPDAVVFERGSIAKRIVISSEVEIQQIFFSPPDPPPPLSASPSTDHFVRGDISASMLSIPLRNPKIQIPFVYQTSSVTLPPSVPHYEHLAVRIQRCRSLPLKLSATTGANGKAKGRSFATRSTFSATVTSGSCRPHLNSPLTIIKSMRSAIRALAFSLLIWAADALNLRKRGGY